MQYTLTAADPGFWGGGGGGGGGGGTSEGVARGGAELPRGVCDRGAPLQPSQCVWESALSSPRPPETNAYCVEPLPLPKKYALKNRSRLGSHTSRAQPMCMFKVPIN